ncbi:MAG: hypothetical protein QQN63_10325, partial [Nitrosopumilus sp.]
MSDRVKVEWKALAKLEDRVNTAEATESGLRSGNIILLNRIAKLEKEIAKLKELLIERDGILADQFKDLKELNDRVLLIELGQQHDKTT